MSESTSQLLDIQAATGTEFVETHDCESSPLPEAIHVVRAGQAAKYPEAGWTLVNVWYADSGDVASGDAEKIGEITQVAVIGIRFCPFCGSAFE